MYRTQFNSLIVVIVYVANQTIAWPDRSHSIVKNYGRNMNLNSMDNSSSAFHILLICLRIYIYIGLTYKTIYTTWFYFSASILYVACGVGNEESDLAVCRAAVSLDLWTHTWLLLWLVWGDGVGWWCVVVWWCGVGCGVGVECWGDVLGVIRVLGGVVWGVVGVWWCGGVVCCWGVSCWVLL